MSDYSFILENLYFSYSSVSSFETCQHGFFLAYIDAEERLGNFYSDFGLHIHDVLEKYFKGELEQNQLSEYYSKNYDSTIKNFPPPYPIGLAGDYKKQGQMFFDYFYFDKDLYDVVLIEEALKTEFDGIKLVVKPDLILREKSTGKNILFDYKSSNAFIKEKRDKKKFEGYIKQMYIYKYFVEKIKNIKIDSIILWFPRLDRMEPIEIIKEDEEKTIWWLKNTIEKIMNENDFVANTKNKYFCENLCSCRNSCKFFKNGS